MTRVIVAGAGRMGRRVLALLARHADLEAAAVIVRSRRGDLGVTAVSSLSAAPAADVLIDFTAPAGCAQLLPEAVAKRLPYVLASTGLESQHEAAVAAASAAIPIVRAANFSVGISVLTELAQLAAARLGMSFDVEIAELHHRGKRDAPSGTALSLGRAVEAGRGKLESVVGRSGAAAPRPSQQLGYAALRGGDVSGEHTVFYLGEGERLELTHRATTPDIFADGALRAARWLIGKPPGIYGMQDVLRG